MLWLTLSKWELGQQRQQEGGGGGGGGGGHTRYWFSVDFDFKIWGVATNELQ